MWCNPCLWSFHIALSGAPKLSLARTCEPCLQLEGLPIDLDFTLLTLAFISGRIWYFCCIAQLSSCRVQPTCGRHTTLNGGSLSPVGAILCWTEAPVTWVPHYAEWRAPVTCGRRTMLWNGGPLSVAHMNISNSWCRWSHFMQAVNSRATSLVHTRAGATRDVGGS